MRVVEGVGSLRQRDHFLAIRAATKIVLRRGDFRIVHMSIQRTHLHLIVEASSQRALSTGIQAFTISAARRINQACSARRETRRRGRVIQERYHARRLSSPRDVRNTIVYCLGNWRHHSEDRSASGRWPIDLYSSAPTYGGWREPFSLALPPSYQPLCVRGPQTWLLRHWTEHHPPISITEAPARYRGIGRTGSPTKARARAIRATIRAAGSGEARVSHPDAVGVLRPGEPDGAPGLRLGSDGASRPA